MAEAYDYVLGRSYTEGLRLETQHLLLNIHNGYTIDPKIPITPETKIADMGTGTGIWLLDMATQVPSTVQLDGFDISDEQFPHKSNRPSNINFWIMDALSEVPDEFIEKYDVVHMRFWACVIRDGDTAALIKHATQLLKPGGYLHWDDGDLSKLYIKGPEAEAFSVFARKAYEVMGFKFEWLEDLPNLIQQAGLEVLKFKMEPFSKVCTSIATRPFVLGHIPGNNAVYKTGNASLPPRHEVDALLANLIGAIKNGAALHQTLVSLLARKPVRS
ncbi:hypothetical protein ACHAQJ_001357 [Trichoderma viride]